MRHWDNIIKSYARTGKFHGSGQRSEDAYYAFFHEEPARPCPPVKRWLAHFDLGSFLRTQLMQNFIGTIRSIAKLPRDDRPSGSTMGR